MGVISQQYDSIGRNSGFAAVSGYHVGYSYDSLGRFHSVSSSVFSALSAVNYSHLSGSDLLAGYTLADPVANFQFQVSRTFEPHRDLITSNSNTWNGAPIGNFAYANDLLARRVARVDNGSVSNVFGYNIRSELTSAAMGTNQFTYIFDAIGNRRFATNNAEILNYSANELNQYTNILRISAPPRETLPTYDLDGNTTFLPAASGESWHCQWDGENRLVGASNAAVNARYSYDYMSRRYQKIASGVTNRFLYDGWNLIAEVIADNGSLITNLYTWGLDIAEQMGAGVPRHSAPGATAGGIGGLLSVTRNGATYFPCADANGNITDYVDTNGTVVAHRDFDAFGNTILATGPLVHDLHFWFSTKYLDEETGLYYYGYRYYSPELGRWLSRDPVGEYGGLNLYVFCDGNPIDLTDPYGLLSLPPWLRNLLPDWALSVDDILGFGWSALRNNPEITLSGDVLELIKNDPDMLRYDQEITDAVMAAVLQYRRPNTMAWRCIAFSLPPKRGTVTFGGNRAPQNMWEQLQGFWRPEYRATWRVGANPLTWMLRHANVRSQTEVNLCFNCLAFAGTYSTDYELSDTLDLRPHRHGNHDFELLLHPQDDPYDAATILLGTIWHDLFRRRDNIRVKAEWERDMLFLGVW